METQRAKNVANQILSSNEKYDEYVKNKSPKSNLLGNCIKAFLVGGSICTIGEIILRILKNCPLEKEDAGTLTTIILIFFGALLTGLNIYNRLGKFAGAGSIVPVTGFANSVVSPAMEHRKEGFVMGMGAKMFIVAGPVLVYGFITSFFCGIVHYALKYWFKF